MARLGSHSTLTVKILTSQPEPQSLDDLFGHLAEIKASAIRNVAIGRNLLERLDQVDRVDRD